MHKQEFASSPKIIPRNLSNNNLAQMQHKREGEIQMLEWKLDKNIPWGKGRERKWLLQQQKTSQCMNLKCKYASVYPSNQPWPRILSVLPIYTVKRVSGSFEELRMCVHNTVQKKKQCKTSGATSSGSSGSKSGSKLEGRATVGTPTPAANEFCKQSS